MIDICLVEDESNLSEIIQLNLELEGYKVTVFNHGKRAKDHFENTIEYDLIILDVMLPEVNGIELCEVIRKTSSVPVLFLSAKGTTSDRIDGLKAGGNDYLPKPFDLEELLLRVKVLLGGKITSQEEELTIGNCTVNYKTYEVVNKQNGNVARLSKKEVLLLQLFSEKEGEVISRNGILDEVWGKDQFPTTRTIDNYILNFRKLFEKDPKNPIYFHSIRGVGYKFTK